MPLPHGCLFPIRMRRRLMLKYYGMPHYILWIAGGLLWAVMYVLLIVLEEVD